MIDTVIFDIGNVLAAFCWREFLEQMGYEEQTREALGKALFLSKNWAENDRGVVPHEEMVRRFIKDAPEYEKEILECFEKIEGVVEPYSYSLDWVRRLKAKGFRVYALSNYPERLYEVTRKQKLSFLDEMDGAVISYQVKLLKPDREIYECLLDKYQLDPERAVFIDDLKANVEGARKAGLSAVLFTDRETVLKKLEELGVFC